VSGESGLTSSGHRTSPTHRGERVWLLWLIARRRLLEEWYGHGKVEAVRVQLPRTGDQARFWSLTIGGLVIGLAWGARGESIELIQRAAVGTLLGCIAGAVLVRRSDRTPLTTLLEGDR
jgi:LPXTG-motif cell wall-anchored protein